MQRSDSLKLVKFFTGRRCGLASSGAFSGAVMQPAIRNGAKVAANQLLWALFG